MNPEKLSHQLQARIQQAQQITADHHHSELTPLHLLIACLEAPESLIGTLSPQISSLRTKTATLLESLAAIEHSDDYTPGVSRSTQALLSDMESLKKELGDEYLTEEHLILAMSRSNDLKKIFTEERIGFDELKKSILTLRNGRTAQSASSEELLTVLKKYTVDLVEKARAGKIDPVIGREDEIHRTLEILSRRSKNNPVLVGDPGVGKTAIVEGIAHKIVAGEVPDTLRDTRILTLDIGGLLAGAKYRGEFEERLKSIVEEVKKSEGSIVLFIDEIHTIVGAGNQEGGADASNLLKPALSRGEIKLIGASTLTEYRKYIEKDGALERRFQPVMVDEPSDEEAVAILRGLKERYELFHGIKITDAAIVQAVELSRKYLIDRKLPDKAIDLIDEAAASVKLSSVSKPIELDKLEKEIRTLEIQKEALTHEGGQEKKLLEVQEKLANLQEKHIAQYAFWKKERELMESIQANTEKIEALRVEALHLERSSDFQNVARIQYKDIPELEAKNRAIQTELDERKARGESTLRESVTVEDIAIIISRWTGIPSTRLLESERQKYLSLSSRLKSHIIGQDVAIDRLSEAILRNKAGLSDPNRPIGSFLFLGPTGVGKTETAKALATELFGDPSAMIRIDMSEYLEAHTVARLIGSPPGYIGHDEGGQLTEAVRRKPYSVILFDEIEKAHPEVFSVFLQILDDGRLTDGKGRMVSFKNTIIIMTSNAITDTGSLDPLDDGAIRKKLIGQFRPEFLNRIDEVLLYRPLSNEGISRIIDGLISEINTQLSDRSIHIDITSSLRSYLSDEGYDPELGARPLKRLISRSLITPLSRSILAGDVSDETHILLDYQDDQVVIHQKNAS